MLDILTSTPLMCHSKTLSPCPSFLSTPQGVAEGAVRAVMARCMEDRAPFADPQTTTSADAGAEEDRSHLAKSSADEDVDAKGS